MGKIRCDESHPAPSPFSSIWTCRADKLSVRVPTLDAAVEKIWRSAEAEAKPGNGQDLKLPEPEPWPELVDGAVLLDDIVIEFRRYLVLPDYAAEVLALWAVHAHAFGGKAGDVLFFSSDIWHRRMPTGAGPQGRFFHQFHYGRRDMVQRIRTTDQVNHLSEEAKNRIESDRERTVLGLHPPGYYDG